MDESTASGGRPSQIHLLRRDGGDQRLERVADDGRTQPREPFDQPGHSLVAVGQVDQRPAGEGLAQLPLEVGEGSAALLGVDLDRSVGELVRPVGRTAATR